jgi:hypothetical protein
MSTIHLHETTTSTPEQFVAGLTDFGPGRSKLFDLVAPGRAARPLDAIKRFMSENSAVMMMVVLLLLGAKLPGDGLAVL